MIGSCPIGERLQGETTEVGVETTLGIGAGLTGMSLKEDGRKIVMIGADGLHHGTDRMKGKGSLF